MNKFIKLLCLTCVLCMNIFAQNQPDDYRKNEFYGGYSNQQIEGGNYRTANGFEAAYVRNIHRYFGLKADFSAAYQGDDFTVSFNDPTNGAYSYRINADRSVYNILGGVQVKNNAAKSRFKPFAHALAGVAITREKFDRLTCTSGTCPAFVGNSIPLSFTNTNFAAAIGGGLDVKISDKIDLRAIQVDYNPIYRGGNNWQNNFRIGVGVVFK